MKSIIKRELTKLKMLNGYATLKTNNPRRNKPMILK